MYDLRENEHQELFYFGADLTRPVALHVPSPLGSLGYYLFIRIAPETVRRLDRISVQFDLIGLHETHTTLTLGEGALKPAILPSIVAGLVWFCLGKAKLARGDGPMVFNGWPADLKEVDLLLCTWPRFVESGEADRRLAARSDPLWAPSGVPLGGIGGGRVDFCRDGRFRNFSMNNNQDGPQEHVDGLPGAYVAVESEGITVDLASRPLAGGHQICKTMEYKPRFPQAELRAQQIVKGIDATLTFSGTLCPHDLRRSSIPGFLLRWELRNTTTSAKTVKCLMGWPNLIGIGGGVGLAESRTGYGDGYYHHWDDPTGRRESRVENDAFVAIRFAGEPKRSFLPSAGQHLLGVSREGVNNIETILGEGHGEMAVEVEVPARGVSSVLMAFVADMPHWVDTLNVDRGRFWQNHFSSGDEMLAVLFRENEDFFQEAGALAVLLDDSSLPDWLRRRLSNCTYPLVTNSVHYRDGRFSVNEGPTEMAGCYGTIDQRLGAHAATQLLFPDLNAKELSEFAAIQGPQGGIQHDLGGGHLERTSAEHSWPDLSCSFIIQTARHAWSTGDRSFDSDLWPRARRALLRHALWADEGKGVAQVGKGLGTSYDSYHYIGTTGYIGTLWLATLAVAEKWAWRKGDKDLLVKIPIWREAAVKRLETDLWNGAYYIAYGDQQGTKRETSHAGQLAGQMFARVLAGTDVLPKERIRSCINAMLTLNGGRRYALPPDECSPDGKEVSAFGWLPYIEAFMLTACATEDSTRVWPIWKRIVRIMDDDTHPCDTRLMYRVAQGEPSWGAYYMTAPASWLVYEALLDFFYSPAEGVFRLGTAVPGRYPLVHPLFWGTAQVSADGRVTLAVLRVFGGESLKVTMLELPSSTVSVEAQGRTVTAVEGQNRYNQYELVQPWLLEAGINLSWRIRYT